MRRRLDAELVRRGLAASRGEARDLVLAGRVTVSGAPAEKPTRQVAGHEDVAVAAADPRWASRGGAKLEGALVAFAGVNPAGRTCLDAGASTGGFTDVLLARDAAAVWAVDVGYGQLAWRLRRHERVWVRDRCNVRHLTAADVPDDLPGPLTLVVADLSFISLRLVLPALSAVAAPDADYVLLVKPQFEVGRGEVGRGGVVRSPEAWRRALLGVADAAAEHGLAPQGACPSSEPGPAGNVEFFWWLRAGCGLDPEAVADAAVAAVPEVAGVGCNGMP